MSTQSGVGVQTGDDDVDHEKVEGHRAEGEQVDPGRLYATPAGRRPGMQVARVDHPCDERPRLFGIPAPVAAPGCLGPDRAGNDAEGPDREAESDGAVRDAVERV